MGYVVSFVNIRVVPLQQSEFLVVRAQYHPHLQKSTAQDRPILSRLCTMKLLLVAVAVATLSTVQVEAKQEFVKLIPNAARVSGVTAIGHTDGTGASSANNDFGKAFDSAGKVWTLNLCKADTDGDGQTNGQELGDPC
ncbi:hypothetical protein PF010_g29171 [Phytophthora fragariae]|uniref:Temptin Cys/Cys disulfide domain-containing protein n=1 Tax=Phytophthora fragariae TaxID=53985 RepID=A0A6G0MH37_9STRA|nr:hypothetical protein PF010_g29171 [Phytophthora fragariae]KAE9167219.1 hypothetical protein PF004_g28892 [Phytophthora fragariae]